MLAAADVNSVAHLLNIYWNNLTVLFWHSFYFSFFFRSFSFFYFHHLSNIYIIPSNQTFQEQNWTIFNCSSVKPLITNTSKEFIKCRILHFLIMECCRYLVFLIKCLYEKLLVWTYSAQTRKEIDRIDMFSRYKKRRYLPQ